MYAGTKDQITRFGDVINLQLIRNCIYNDIRSSSKSYCTSTSISFMHELEINIMHEMLFYFILDFF